MSEQSPSTQVGQNAKNENGQCNTMSGTTTKWEPPTMDMHTTKNVGIDPCSSMGCKQFEKK